MKLKQHKDMSRPQPPPFVSPARVCARMFTMGAAMTLMCVGLILLETSCTTTRTKDEWLRVFFDGVPTEEERQAAANPAVEQPPESKHAEVAARLATVLVRPTSVHSPYEDHDCKGCHESSYSQKLRGTVKEVCLSCHEDFPTEAKSVHYPVEEGECLECHSPHESEHPFLLVRPRATLCVECHDDLVDAQNKHDPAEEGECLECHSPHASDNASLLLRTGNALCYECHDSVTEAEFKHDPAAEGECLACHSPHASDNPSLLLRTGAALCYECHDSMTEAEFKHDPVAEGECLECHSPHASNLPFQLRAKGQALCYQCHDEDDITGSESHLDMGKEDCTTCHDPHQGEKEYFLKPLPKKTPGGRT